MTNNLIVTSFPKCRHIHDEIIIINFLLIVEAQLDEEIKQLDNMDEDDLEAMRRKRMQQMKKAQV